MNDDYYDGERHGYERVTVGEGDEARVYHFPVDRQRGRSVDDAVLTLLTQAEAVSRRVLARMADELASTLRDVRGDTRAIDAAADRLRLRLDAWRKQRAALDKAKAARDANDDESA